MIRGAIDRTYLGLNPDFRYRGEEQTRIETLSDAVFALAITLLLISSSSSRNFKELIDFTNELIPFALCITPIMMVWHEHFVFFLRYGLRNKRVVVLNTILLFILLFYVYPLKFLAELLYTIFGYFLTGSQGLAHRYGVMMTDGNIAVLMIIYGCGFAGLYFVFAAMYVYAGKKADALELNRIERFHTRMSVIKCLIIAAIPLVSMVFAIVFINNHEIAGMLSGYCYFLYPVVMTVFSRWAGKKRKALEATSQDS